MDRVHGFEHSLLQDAVASGAAGRRSARVWFRSSRSGTHRIEYWDRDRPTERRTQEFESLSDNASDGTGIVVLRDGIEPGRRYDYVIDALGDDHRVGSGSFESAPDTTGETAQRFSFGLISCHMPFSDEGRVKPECLHVLNAAPSILKQERCARLLWVGDQMYSDLPEGLSLSSPGYFRGVTPRPDVGSILDLTREEVRRLYQKRYRLYWNFGAIRVLMSDWSSHYIWDDHELVDNFGSKAEHRSHAWRNRREGAADAFYDYQASRTISQELREHQQSFHHAFRFGPVSTFVMDLRSQKHRTDDRVEFYDCRQFRDLETFLELEDEAQVIVVVLTVPVFRGLSRGAIAISKILPRRATQALDDNWSSPLAKESRERLLSLLRRHAGRPGQKVVLLSGDIHSGSASEVRWRVDATARERPVDRPVSMFEFVSSPITHQRPGIAKKSFLPKGRWVRRIRVGGERAASVHLVAGDGGAWKNPVEKNNLGVIEFERRGDRTGVRFKLFGETASGVELVYRSRWC